MWLELIMSPLRLMEASAIRHSQWTLQLQTQANSAAVLNDLLVHNPQK